MYDKLLIKLNKNLEELNKRLSFLTKNVFNAKEAADYLGIGYDTILRLARIGQIEHIKNGTHYLFKREYLDEWLDKNKRIGGV